MSGWQLADTAPRDGTVVDIWVRGFRWRYPLSIGGRGEITCYRVTDCHFSKSWGGWVDSRGKAVTGRWFYDQGVPALDPTDTGDEAFVATHWMQPPPAPGPRSPDPEPPATPNTQER